MTSVMHSDLPYVSERNAHELVLSYSGSLRGARKNQPKARTLKQTFGSPSSLLLLSALIFLVAQCALYLKTYRYSGDSSRRLSDRRSHRSPATSLSTRRRSFQLPPYEDACNHQDQSSNSTEENVESGLQSPAGHGLPTYEEACRSPPQGRNSFVRSPRSQNPAEGPYPLPSYEEACGSQGQSSGGNTQSWRSPHAAVGQAALPSYEEACGNQASSNDGNEQNGRNRGAVAEGGRAATHNASAARGGLRGVLSTALSSIASIVSETRGMRRNGSRRRQRRSQHFDFPRLCDEQARSVLQNLMKYIEGLSSDVSMEEPKEFCTVLMGAHFSFDVFQERPHSSWPNAGALQRFANTLESSVLGSADTLLEEESLRECMRTIEINSSRGGESVGRTVVTITARRPPEYDDDS